jgi:hypothetical protein
MRKSVVVRETMEPAGVKVWLCKQEAPVGRPANKEQNDLRRSTCGR